MKLRMRCLSLVTVAIACSSAQIALADVGITLALPDFNEGEQSVVVTDGSATLHKGGVRLTDAIGATVGAAYHKQPVTMSAHRSFSSYFSFRMSNPRCPAGQEGGADGLAFVIQPDLNAKGKSGGGLGFEGIPSSVAIEFDSFFNEGHKDPKKHHIGINTNGVVESLHTAEVPFILNNGQIYHAWIDYDGKDDSLQVRLATSNNRPADPTLSYKVDLEKTLRTEQYVGFTASTGSCSEQHELLAMYFNVDYLPGGIDTSLDNYSTE